jgi:hypothetical protein
MEDRMFRQRAGLTPLQTMGVLAMLFRFYYESQSNGLVPDTPEHRMLLNDSLETRDDSMIEHLLESGVLLRYEHGGQSHLALHGWEETSKKENSNQVKGAHAKNVMKKMTMAAKCAESQLELLRTEKDEQGNPMLSKVMASELNKKLAYAFLLSLCSVINRVAPTTPAATLEALVHVLETVNLEDNEVNKDALIWCKMNHMQDYRLRADLNSVIRYWPSLVSSSIKQEIPQTRAPERDESDTGQLFPLT